MGGTLEIPFAIGQKIWTVSRIPKEEWIVCPDCNGTRRIKMIKGNGEEVSLFCATCSIGYEPPMGAIKVFKGNFKPSPFTCNGVEISFGKIRYSEEPPGSTWASWKDSEDLFLTEEEAQARGLILQEEHKEKEKEKLNYTIKNRRRDMSYSVTYWSRVVKSLEQKLEAARERLGICKEKGEK